MTLLPGLQPRARRSSLTASKIGDDVEREGGVPATRMPIRYTFSARCASAPSGAVRSVTAAIRNCLRWTWLMLPLRSSLPGSLRLDCDHESESAATILYRIHVWHKCPVWAASSHRHWLPMT